MRRLADAFVLLGALLVVLAVLGLIAAIWIVGPDSARAVSGTSFIVLLSGLALYAIGATQDIP